MKWTKRWHWGAGETGTAGASDLLVVRESQGGRFERLSLLKDILPVYKQGAD